jgi:hypothetical protein
MASRGRFTPKNPQKYLGDSSRVFFRSSWELRTMKFLDQHSSILAWNSECIKIPYLSPIDNKIHQYIPDFFVEYVDPDGVINQEVVEIKPLHESDKKHAKSDRSKNALEVNNSKWKAAAFYCETHGLTFKVLTEQTLFRQKPKNE